MTGRNIQYLASAMVFAALPILIYAYAEGPQPGYSGVPGESGTCAVCHAGPSGSGSVKVTFPNGPTYTPGVSQTLTVTVADPAQRRWGFELTVRQASSRSTQAGTFTPGSDGFTQIVCANASVQAAACPADLEYIEHTLAGTRDGTTGSATFQFTWTPPSTNIGDLTVYVAGNAANGDGQDTGDHIYTAQYAVTPSASSASPAVTAVVNGASFQPGISSGSWVSITGSNLAPTTAALSSSEMVNGKLPTQMANVSVSIDNKAAAIDYVSPTQINVQAPSDSNTGSVAVQVTNNGQTSNSFSANLAAETPAFFLWSGKYVVATRQDFSLIGPTSLFPGSSTPVAAGAVVILWGTGFGPTTPAAPIGQLVPSTQLYSVVNPPSITIGGVSATVSGTALAPGFAGLYQVAIQIPSTVASGDQAVVARVESISSPSGTYITVQ